MLTLYGIGSCDTCRRARTWLTAQSYEYNFHDLRDDGIDIQLLERWAERIAWEKLLNTRSLTWRKLPEVDRADMSKDRALASMLEHPTLVKRPVLECSEFIAVGFSPQNYKAIFMQI
jgi:Spx/MgsR family transcriptional regulator